MHLLREMTPADIATAFQIRTSAVENALSMQELEDDYELTPETLANALLASAKGWVYEVGGVVVGFAMGDSDEGELTVLAVLPEHEGRGIGKALLAKVESWLAEMGHQEIWLVTTPDSRLRAYKLYKSQGWVATGEIMDDDEKFVKSASQ